MLGLALMTFACLNPLAYAAMPVIKTESGQCTYQALRNLQEESRRRARIMQGRILKMSVQVKLHLGCLLVDACSQKIGTNPNSWTMKYC